MINSNMQRSGQAVSKRVKSNTSYKGNNPAGYVQRPRNFVEIVVKYIAVERCLRICLAE